MRELLNKIYLADTGITLIDWLSDFIYDKIKWMRSSKEKIERMSFWGWHMRNSYDFDAGTVYDMLHLKFDRLHKCFRDHSTCMWTSDENSRAMRRVKIVSILSKRLATLNIRTNVEEHYKNFPPTGDYNRVYSKQETRSMKRAWQMDNQQEKNEKELLFKILKRNMDYMWD